MTQSEQVEARESSPVERLQHQVEELQARLTFWRRSYYEARDRADKAEAELDQAREQRDAFQRGMNAALSERDQAREREKASG